MEALEDVPDKYIVGGIGIAAVGVGLAYAGKWAHDNRYLEVKELWDTRIKPPEFRKRRHNEEPLERRRARESHRSHVANVEDMESTYKLKLQPFGEHTSTSMRLVTIHDGNPRDPMYCTVDNVDMSSHSNYIALSYTWGDITSRRKLITVNTVVERNQSIEVTVNLYDALVELRNRKQYRVWSDYLCIDQGKKEDPAAEKRMTPAQIEQLEAARQRAKAEKERQLLNMRSIYSGAEKVVAWLGRGNRNASNLIKTLEKLNQFPNKKSSMMYELGRMWMGSLKVKPYMLSNYRRRQTGSRQQILLGMLSLLDPHDIERQDKQLRKIQVDFMNQVRSMANREYWRRAWIIEEVAVAWDVEYFCGQETLDFQLFTTILAEINDLYPANIHEGFWTDNHSHVLTLRSFRERKRNSEPVHLLEALQETYNVNTSRAEDRIYALLGMCHDWEAFIHIPRYKIALDDIIVGMVQKVIKGRLPGSLDIICLQSTVNTGRSDGLPPAGLPSWAPDLVSIGLDRFNDRMVNYLIKKDEYPETKRATSPPNMPRKKAWNATDGSIDPRPRFYDTDEIFRATGAMIGTIEVLSQACGLFMNVFEAHRRISYGQREPYELVREIFETFTIYMERNDKDSDNCDFNVLWKPETLKDLKSKDEDVYKWLVDQADLMLFDKTLKEWSAGIAKAKKFLDRSLKELVVEGKPSRVRDDKIIDAFCRVMKDEMRLIATAEGHVGWAHPRAEPDDQICLLAGCTMPVIVRQKRRSFNGNPTYRVIGDAYIYGAMHGQYWKKLKTHNIYLA